MPTRTEVISSLVQKYNAQITSTESAVVETAIMKLAIAQLVDAAFGGGGVGLGDPFGSNPNPVVVTTNTFTDNIPIYNWADEPFVTGNPSTYPATNDPRWVQLSFPAPIRIFYLGFTNIVTKKLLSGYFATRLRVFLDVEGKIYPLSTLNPVNGSQSISPIAAYTTPIPFSFGRILVSWELGQWNNTGSTASLIGVDRNRIVGAWGYGNYTANFDTPTDIRFDYSRQSLTVPAVYGAMGAIKSFNPITDAIQYDWAGYTVPVGRSVKLLAVADPNFTHPPGIGYVADASSIDQLSNTIIVKGSIPPIIGKALRIRLLSGTIGTQASGLVSFSRVTQLSTNTWAVELAYINSRLILDSYSANRWIYFSYYESPELTLAAGNTLQLNGVTVDLFDELQDSCTITPGTPTVFTWANHGRSVGDKLEVGFSAATGTYPTELNISRRIVYVSEVLTINTIAVSEYPGVPSVALITAGTLLTMKFGNNTPVAVTASSSVAATINCPNHGLALSARVQIAGTTIPVGLTANTDLFVKTTALNTFTLSGVRGGMPVAFSSAGVATTLSGTNTLTFPGCPIELAQYTLTGTDKAGEYDIRDSDNGYIFPLAGTNLGAVMIESVENPSVTGQCNFYAAY